MTKLGMFWNTPRIAQWALDQGAFGNAALVDLLGCSNREVRSIVASARIASTDLLAQVVLTTELPLDELVEIRAYEPAKRATRAEKIAAAMAEEPALFTEAGDFAELAGVTV